MGEAKKMQVLKTRVLLRVHLRDIEKMIRKANNPPVNKAVDHSTE